MTATLLLAGRDGGSVQVNASRLDALVARLVGPVLRPGDQGWDSAVQTWNAGAASEPAIVVQPECAADVATAVEFARDSGVLLSVKGGGHNIAGTALAAGALTLDMARMNTVDVHPDALSVDVGPGCLLRDVDRATQEYGLATVLGFISEVGVAGLTLGGGFGYLMRRFGWAVDNLESVEIVTADGLIRNAGRAENPELFWALRGGGGNFGVVTRFTFRLHHVGPTVVGGLLLWSANRADQVMAAYQALTATAPIELTAALIMRIAPPEPFIPAQWHGKPVIGMLICHSGEAADDDLAGIRALADPIVDLIGERPYAEQQSMMDGGEPKGQNYYWKTEFLPELSRGFLDTFRAAAMDVPDVRSESVIFHIGGVANIRANDDGAVGNRNAHFVTGFAGAWPVGADPTPHRDWVRHSWAAIMPFSTGGNYINFQLDDDDPARTAASYGPNLIRLRLLKQEFDPDNVFRVNRNIPPAQVARSAG